MYSYRQSVFHLSDQLKVYERGGVCLYVRRVPEGLEIIDSTGHTVHIVESMAEARQWINALTGKI